VKAKNSKLAGHELDEWNNVSEAFLTLGIMRRGLSSLARLMQAAEAPTPSV